MPELEITRHAQDRAKKRMGLNARALERMAQRAYETGLRHSGAKGRLKRWIDGRYLEHGTADNIRIYGRHVFIFCGHTLVTILYLPKGLIKLAEKCREQATGNQSKN